MHRMSRGARRVLIAPPSNSASVASGRMLGAPELRHAPPFTTTASTRRKRARFTQRSRRSSQPFPKRLPSTTTISQSRARACRAANRHRSPPRRSPRSPTTARPTAGCVRSPPARRYAAREAIRPNDARSAAERPDVRPLTNRSRAWHARRNPIPAVVPPASRPAAFARAAEPFADHDHGRGGRVDCSVWSTDSGARRRR